MALEMQKSVVRRVNDCRFLREYFVGDGIDIGSGDDCLAKYQDFFPLLRSVRPWDVSCGDAQYLVDVDDDCYDFAVSSHCLEHMMHAHIALKNWIRVVKPKGHLVITVPDEDMYEQGHWPSIYNHDHKATFTIMKHQSWSPVSLNVLDLVGKFASMVTVKKIELLDSLHLRDLAGDQTRHSCSESAIEIVLQKT